MTVPQTAADPRPINMVAASKPTESNNLQHLGTYRPYWLEACLTPQAAARILSDGCFGSSPIYFCVDAVGRGGTFLSRMPGEKTLSAFCLMMA